MISFFLQGQGLLSLLGRKLKCLAVDFSVVVLVSTVGALRIIYDIEQNGASYPDNLLV